MKTTKPASGGNASTLPNARSVNLGDISEVICDLDGIARLLMDGASFAEHEGDKTAGRSLYFLGRSVHDLSRKLDTATGLDTFNDGGEA